jgi:SAM-dependent methyltransferase
MPAFDTAAASFERHRTLPAGVAAAIRKAVLAQLAPRPRLLDLGAGTGRIGSAFVAANDDYVGLDLSGEMLRGFSRRDDLGAHRARLVQGDGARLPFADASFDAVLLVQVFGGLSSWRGLIDEARRVLRPAGTLMLGRTRSSDDGLDARMKRQLAVLLAGMDIDIERRNSREQAERYLASLAPPRDIVAASWTSRRSPRGFLDRHAKGAQFAALPEAARDEALRLLATWAETHFGSLDAEIPEPQQFTLRLFTFAEG